MSFSDLSAFHIDFHFAKETLLPYLFLYDYQVPPSSISCPEFRMQSGGGRVVAVTAYDALRQQVAFVINFAWQADCVMCALRLAGQV